MPIAVQPAMPVMAALAADLGVVLKPGTVVDARVVEVLSADLVRLAIASLTLDVPTTRPLLQGQSLQLAVAQNADGLALTPVAAEPSAAPRAPAVMIDDIPLAPRAAGPPAAQSWTPLETRAIASAAQDAVTKQGGLSPLFADLSAAIATGKLPQPVQIAAAQLLGLRMPTSAISGRTIENAMKSSGLLMESRLAESTEQAAMPDMKSALLVLRQTLATWAPADGETAMPPQARPLPTSFVPPPPPGVADAPAASSVPARDPRLGDAAVASMVSSVEPLPAGTAAKSLLALQIMASALRVPVAAGPEETVAQPVPPPVRGAPPAAQPVASPSLAIDLEPAATARHLLAETDGALARQTLLQIASLPDRADAQGPRGDPAQPRWNFEIPLVTPQGTAMAQFEIARDGASPGAETAQRVWRARFSLDIEPAGPIHALVVFGGESTSVRMWAERPATAARLRANAFELTQSLDRADLNAGDIVVADGAPARAKVASGHFLSRAT